MAPAADPAAKICALALLQKEMFYKKCMILQWPCQLYSSNNSELTLVPLSFATIQVLWKELLFTHSYSFSSKWFNLTKMVSLMLLKLVEPVLVSITYPNDQIWQPESMLKRSCSVLQKSRGLVMMLWLYFGLAWINIRLSVSLLSKFWNHSP